MGEECQEGYEPIAEELNIQDLPRISETSLGHLENFYGIKITKREDGGYNLHGYVNEKQVVITVGRGGEYDIEQKFFPILFRNEGEVDVDIFESMIAEPLKYRSIENLKGDSALDKNIPWDGITLDLWDAYIKIYFSGNEKDVMEEQFSEALERIQKIISLPDSKAEQYLSTDELALMKGLSASSVLERFKDLGFLDALHRLELSSGNYNQLQESFALSEKNEGRDFLCSESIGARQSIQEELTAYPKEELDNSQFKDFLNEYGFTQENPTEEYDFRYISKDKEIVLDFDQSNLEIIQATMTSGPNIKHYISYHELIKNYKKNGQVV